jgi:hypothetical protein
MAVCSQHQAEMCCAGTFACDLCFPMCMCIGCAVAASCDPALCWLQARRDRLKDSGGAPKKVKKSVEASAEEQTL